MSKDLYFSQQISAKYSNIKFHKNSPSGIGVFFFQTERLKLRSKYSQLVILRTRLKL